MIRSFLVFSFHFFLVCVKEGLTLMYALILCFYSYFLDFEVSMFKKSYEGLVVDLFKPHWSWPSYFSFEALCLWFGVGLKCDSCSWGSAEMWNGFWRCGREAAGGGAGEQSQGENPTISLLHTGQQIKLSYLVMQACDETAVWGSISVEKMLSSIL